MKQSFGEYLKANPWFYPVLILIPALWVYNIINYELWGLWILTMVTTGATIIGVKRNLDGKDGLWGG
jgi:hypothetical protein